MQLNSIQALLHFFCRRLKDNIIFASLWRYNACCETVSIYSRSSIHFFPQLGCNGENINEFICTTECASIKSLLQSDYFLERKRYNYSISAQGAWDLFHSEETVSKYDLDELVFLPIDTEHAKNISDGRPRFFCLFYCRPGTRAADLHDLDLSLVQSCIGNMIYNSFTAKRQQIVRCLTDHLSENHDPESPQILEFVRRNCTRTKNAYRLSIQSLRNKTIKVISAGGNEQELTQKQARSIWERLGSDAGATILPGLTTDPQGERRSALVWQQNGEGPRDRIVYVFDGKMTRCPLHGAGTENEGKPYFVNDFGFDDRELMIDVGSHLKAFTETAAEKRRRRNNSRILAHESSQPFFDIQSLLAKNKRHPDHYSWQSTVERIEDATRLGHAMVKMNTELTDQKLQTINLQGSNNYEIKHELSQMKRSLRRVCEDFRFLNDNITIRVDRYCLLLDLNINILSTIFINTVTNSIKYSERKSKDSWCEFSVQRMFANSDREWDRLGAPIDKRAPGLLFSTTDNGVGVPGHLKERVFEQEFQVDNRKSAQGLGLGLWHVKRVVTSLNGDIWLQSGSDFLDGSGIKTRVSARIPMKW